ncbi:class I adenylate-forming enzyme family protein [Massilia consociata]|uniref:Class I adenylate-forming enzyme family protein n=1 Tax=Massilia consociata TaxID=760117 RepID=A0ABV6FIN4_9BURK
MIDPFSLPTRISAIVSDRAASTPHAPALAEAGRTWSYAALQQEVESCAERLRGLGVRPGDRVMLVSENCVAQVALLFAIASLDAWSINVNARLSAHEIAAVRAHCTPRRVLYTTGASPDALAHAARDGAAAVDTAGAAGGLMAGPLDAACVPEPVQAGGDQVAALVYTTGTTGRPKGVMLTHANLLFVAATSSALRGLRPSDHASGVLPVSHVYGLASVMLGTLYAGACLHLAPRFSADALLAQIRGGVLSIVQGVPAMYAKLVALAGPRNAPIPSRLRFCYAGGSPLDPALKRDVEALLGLPLHNGYGLTESAPTVSQTRLDAPRADTSVGLPIPGVAVRIVDAAGTDVAPGDAGELWVRGPNVMAGYYRDPQQTAQALRGGWLATGDVARRDADGALFVLGRIKELIIRGGFKVYPLEVEAALNAHPRVLQSAVVGMPLPAGDEEVVAFVEAAGPLGDDALRDWLRPRLAPYKRPARIVFLDALPAAPNGKILKSRLRQRLPA